jgi:hypothetical protein
MACFDSRQVQLLAGAFERLAGQLGQAADHLAYIRKRFLHESDNPEVGGPGRQVGIGGGGHQEGGQARDPVAEAPDGLESIDPAELGSNEREIEAASTG